MEEVRGEVREGAGLDYEGELAGVVVCARVGVDGPVDLEGREFEAGGCEAGCEGLADLGGVGWEETRYAPSGGVLATVIE